jgi:2-amino-4-hydroxy-6-hydroxymethyldihydropteridine diphosphokinase
MPNIFWIILLFFSFLGIGIFFLFSQWKKRHVWVFLGLGSNIGDREKFLSDALSKIALLGKDIKTSRIWESLPVGGVAKASFLNMVVFFWTKFSPEDLLTKLQNIEELLGRNRTKESRWGDRTMDIDILFYDTMIINKKNLVLPHPYAHKRAFVLFPLLDIDPEFYFFQQKKSLAQLIKILSEKEKKSVWVFSPEKNKKKS